MAQVYFVVDLDEYPASKETQHHIYYEPRGNVPQCFVKGMEIHIPCPGEPDDYFIVEGTDYYVDRDVLLVWLKPFDDVSRMLAGGRWKEFSGDPGGKIHADCIGPFAPEELKRGYTNPK